MGLRSTALSAARLLWLALRIVLAFCWVLLGSLCRAFMRDYTLRRNAVPKEQLLLPLLAARMSDLPYQVDTADQIEASLRTLLADAKLLVYNAQQLMQTHSNWFLCEGRLGAGSELGLFLCFRGTMSPTDAIADVLIRPEAGPNGVMVHGGFLRTVREDHTLHEALQTHVRADKYPLFYVMGHSLGGALSQTIAGAGFLPAYDGRLTIISLGGPLAFYGAPAPDLLDRATASARVLSIVNAHDVVPRLLGSPLTFSRRLLALLTATNNHRQQREREALLDTLELYQGLPGYELLFVFQGAGYRVPPARRRLVLHLAEALHPRLVADHLSYVAAVEAAAGATPWAPVVPS